MAKRLPPSPRGSASPLPVAVENKPEPDMDEVAWAKKHIEIPEMWARLAGISDAKSPDGLPGPVKLVERKTEIIGAGFPLKRVSAREVSDRANRAMFERVDRDMATLRLMIDELRFKLDDIEHGRRPR